MVRQVLRAPHRGLIARGYAAAQSPALITGIVPCCSELGDRARPRSGRSWSAWLAGPRLEAVAGAGHAHRLDRRSASEQDQPDVIDRDRVRRVVVREGEGLLERPIDRSRRRGSPSRSAAGRAVGRRRRRAAARRSRTCRLAVPRGQDARGRDHVQAAAAEPRDVRRLLDRQRRSTRHRPAGDVAIRTTKAQSAEISVSDAWSGEM